MAGSVQRDVPLDLFMPPKPGEGERAGWQCLSSKLISFCKGRASDLISAAADGFAVRCIAGINVDEVRSYANLAQSFGVSTVFLQELGYKRVATMAKRASIEGRPLADIAVEDGHLTQADLRAVLVRAAVPAR